MKRYVVVLLMLVSSCVCAQVSNVYSFADEKKTAQFHHLLSDLRCLVCQNQDLANSNARFAKDLRDEVYEFVQQGQSDEAIVRYLTARYGDFVLFKPPMKGMTALLWWGPALFLLIGLFVFYRTCIQRPKHAST